MCKSFIQTQNDYAEALSNCSLKFLTLTPNEEDGHQLSRTNSWPTNLSNYGVEIRLNEPLL